MKALYAIPTWTRTARLIAEHAALRNAVGGTPSEWACYRFSAKLRAYRPMLNACLSRLTESLRAELPEMGRDVAIDARQPRQHHKVSVERDPLKPAHTKRRKSVLVL